MTDSIRILHVIGAMDRAGAETLIMNLYRAIDRSRIQFDFLVSESRECDYDEEIRSLGGRIFSIPRFAIGNYFSYKKACEAFFAEHGEFSAVHGHIGAPAPVYLSIAKRYGMFTIAHSHNTKAPISPAEFAYRICAYPVRKVADYFMACSQQAGDDRFGTSVSHGSCFHVLKNGIDPARYALDPATRTHIRSELGIDDSTPVFCHVGRLTRQKNHKFLLEAFSHVLKELPQAQLLLVGRGELEEKIRAVCAVAPLSGHVHMLGIRDDVPDILMASDVFLFPSINEGLGLAIIEGQASGLPCLISTGVPKEARICELARFKSLDDGAASWGHEATELFQTRPKDRDSRLNALKAAGYDITSSAAWLSSFYEGLAVRPRS